MRGDEDIDAGAQPRCELCGTVMRTEDASYRCGGCGHWVDIPWVERPEGAEGLPGIGGG
jgi:tRNA(Ile2) C34 agmatinyltransferase TiaS